MNKNSAHRFPYHILIVYFLVGSIWILFSDMLVSSFVPVAYHTTISVAKGWLFIIVTGLLLAHLLTRYHRSRELHERRFREIIDNLPSALYMFDRDGKAVLINRTMAGICRVGAEHCQGRSREELGLAPETAAEHRANDLSVFESGQPMILEEKNLQADGLHTYLTVKFPLTGSDGSVEAVCGVSTDISERKEAEAALRESHARLKKVLEVETVGVMFWDLTSGCLVDANDTFLDLMGYSRHEMEARELTWQKLTPPEYFEVSAAEVRKFLETGRVGPYEKEYLRKDGTRNWFVFAGSSLGNNACVEFCVDISDRKNAEQALRVAQEKLALAQRVAGVGTFEWNIRTNNSIWSPELEVLYGLPPGGFNGTYEAWRELVHPDDLPEAERRIHESLETGSFESEWRVVWPDGSVRWLQGRATVLRDDAGQPERMLGANFDITGRKEVEEKIRQLNASLEQRVAERTSQLEEVNRELEAFSYSVSHDLKAPLRGIDGYSRLLETDYCDRLDEEGRLFIRNIRAGASQMHELIEDLLNYSRMERRSLQSVSLDLQALVRAVVGERAREVEEAGGNLLFEVQPIAVRADRDGLAVVLRNLLENAIKFSSNAQPPMVSIGTRKEGEKALLWVRDNGIGFDMKFHDRIFEIFQRLQRAEDYPGTGVGLALVRKAMQRMGGRVWAESTPGEGATFFLEIPL